MKASVDYGTWKKGQVIKVEADTFDEVFEKAQAIADERGYEGAFVQIKETDTRKLLWDAWHGFYVEEV